MLVEVGIERGLGLGGNHAHVAGRAVQHAHRVIVLLTEAVLRVARDEALRHAVLVDTVCELAQRGLQHGRLGAVLRQSGIFHRCTLLGGNALLSRHRLVGGRHGLFRRNLGRGLRTLVSRRLGLGRGHVLGGRSLISRRLRLLRRFGLDRRTFVGRYLGLGRRLHCHELDPVGEHTVDESAHMERARLRRQHRAVGRKLDTARGELLCLPLHGGLDLLARGVVGRHVHTGHRVEVVGHTHCHLRCARKRNAALEGRVGHRDLVRRRVDVGVGGDVAVGVHVGVLGDEVLHVRRAGGLGHHGLLMGHRVGHEVDDVRRGLVALGVHNLPLAARCDEAIVVHRVLVQRAHTAHVGGGDGHLVAHLHVFVAVELPLHLDGGDGVERLGRHEHGVDGLRVDGDGRPVYGHRVRGDHVAEMPAHVGGAVGVVGKDAAPVDSADEFVMPIAAVGAHRAKGLLVARLPHVLDGTHVQGVLRVGRQAIAAAEQRAKRVLVVPGRREGGDPAAVLVALGVQRVDGHLERDAHRLVVALYERGVGACLLGTGNRVRGQRGAHRDGLVNRVGDARLGAVGRGVGLLEADVGADRDCGRVLVSEAKLPLIRPRDADLLAKRHRRAGRGGVGHGLAGGLGQGDVHRRVVVALVGALRDEALLVGLALVLVAARPLGGHVEDLVVGQRVHLEIVERNAETVDVILGCAAGAVHLNHVGVDDRLVVGVARQRVDGQVPADVRARGLVAATKGSGKRVGQGVVGTSQRRCIRQAARTPTVLARATVTVCRHQGAIEVDVITSRAEIPVEAIAGVVGVQLAVGGVGIAEDVVGKRRPVVDLAAHGRHIKRLLVAQRDTARGLAAVDVHKRHRAIVIFERYGVLDRAVQVTVHRGAHDARGDVAQRLAGSGDLGRGNQGGQGLFASEGDRVGIRGNRLAFGRAVRGCILGLACCLLWARFGLDGLLHGRVGRLGSDGAGKPGHQPHPGQRQRQCGDCDFLGKHALRDVRGRLRLAHRALLSRKSTPTRRPAAIQGIIWHRTFPNTLMPARGHVIFGPK